MKIVVHYAEIGLKGKNRPFFEEQLRKNLTRSLRPVGEARIRGLYGRLLVELPEGTPFEEAESRIQNVFGVAYFSQVSMAEPLVADIERLLDDYIKSRRFESFGLKIRRVDKTHPFTSSGLARQLGLRVQQKTGASVDLSHPELWIEIHVLSRQVLLLHERIPGPGGMPVGTAGRAVSLISGGIDSPVASHQVLKRGCSLSYVHFHSHPFTNAARST